MAQLPEEKKQAERQEDKNEEVDNIVDFSNKLRHSDQNSFWFSNLNPTTIQVALNSCKDLKSRVNITNEMQYLTTTLEKFIINPQMLLYGSRIVKGISLNHIIYNSSDYPAESNNLRNFFYLHIFFFFQKCLII